MDKLDEKIINRIQKDFPVEKQPFKALGDELGISEQSMIERLQKLKDKKYIRRLGGIFDTRKLGFSSTLCAMKAPKERLEEIANIVNSYKEVTHNYSRNASYSLWFTVVAENEERIQEILTELSEKTGIKEVRNFPATQFFKVNVNLKV